MHGIVWTIVIGITAGFLAGKITKGKGFGWIGDLVVGIAGAFIGGFVFGLLGIAATSLIGSLISATVGAVILVAVVRAVMR